MEEAKLLNFSTELSTVTTNTCLNKAWHLVSLLLTVGRPLAPIDLAKLCTLFTEPPEFIEYLCFIPNSPLLLTNDHFVTLSRVAIVAFAQFLRNSDIGSEFVPQIGRGALLQECVSYYRKRRRLVRDDSGIWPLVKRRPFCQNMDDQDQKVLALPSEIQKDSTKEHVHLSVIRSMLTQAASTSVMAFNSEKSDAVMTASSSHINSNAGFLSYGLNNAEPETQHETCMNVSRNELECVYKPECSHPEPSLLTLTMENPVVCREAKMNELHSASRINLNETSCSKVDEQVIISPLEAKNVNYSCEAIVKSVEEERAVEGREAEQLSESGSRQGYFEKLPIDTKDLDKENTTAHVKSQAILSADLLSIDQKQPAKSSIKLKYLHKDALNPVTQTLLDNRKARGAHIEQQPCKRDNSPILMKQKSTENYGQEIQAREKTENPKEKRENTISVSLKNQSESKVLPKFESFIVEEEEGSGGYGTVYRAQRKNDGATLAIKCPHVNANRHHVHNELKMLQRFGGKNFVIKYEGSFKSGNADCIVLEHVEHDRPEILKREIDVFQLQWYGYCLFRALAGLHKQGVVHRDVKPGNFLFSRKASKGYLIDFNLAMDLHQKYGTTDKSAVGYDVSFDHVPLPRAKPIPFAKSRKLAITKASEAVNQEARKSSILPKNQKRKTQHTDLLSRNVIKSQGADGSGITSAKDATSSRIPSADRLREPIPCQGRKELISLAQEAMQGPSHEAPVVPASKRKRVAAPPGRLDRKVVYYTPMPLHSTGIAVAGAGLPKNKGEVKNKREGPCVGTKGFRAPEVLFRSLYQGPKVDIWSAGVTLLYLITGKTPFNGDPDQNIKEIAKIRGSEDLWEVAKLHNRESSFPVELFDVQSLPSSKLRDWCKLNSRRPDFIDIIPRSLFDLVDRCLTVNPRTRISAEEALRHDFFVPCHERLKKQRLLRQGLSLDSATTDLLHKQPMTCEDLS